MFANVFIVCSSVVVLINCIIVPGHNVTKKTLNTIGIKTLGWQGPNQEPNGNIVMHHNYSKVENVNNPRWSQQLNENFDQASQSFDQTSQNFDQVDQRFDQTSQNFDRTSQHFDQTSQNFDQIDQKFDQTSQNVDQIDQNFDQTSQNFDQIIQKHDETNFNPDADEESQNRRTSINSNQRSHNFDFPRGHWRPQQPTSHFPNVFVDGNQQIQRSQKYANLEISVYRKCPKGATGQYAYDLSCNQFLNCWKGRGIVQNCATGTLFNPITLECDFPEKVNCVTGARNVALEANEMSGALQARCPKGFSGIIPHYTDCSKFMTCNDGVEVEMDCPPGTLFDVKTNVCDHAYKCDCADPSLSQSRGHDSRFHQGFTNKFVLVQPYQGNWNYLGIAQNQRGEINDHLGRFSQNQNSMRGTNNEFGGFSQSNGTSYQSGAIGINDQLGGFTGQPGRANDHQFSSHQTQYHHWPNSRTEAGINDQLGGVSNRSNQANDYLGQFSSHQTQYHRLPNARSETGINDQLGGLSNRPNQANEHLGQFSSHQTQYHHRPNSRSEGGINDQLSGFFNQPNPPNDHLGQFSSHQMHQHLPSSTSEASHWSCFPGYFGLRKHSSDCTKYFDCGANGQEKSCPPGTRFNERTSICDDAHKVTCERSEQTQNMDQINGQSSTNQGSQLNQQTDQYRRTQVSSRPKCSRDQVGLYPHPTDCSKFLNCGPNGQTFIQDCGPGTVFNPAIKVCDFPYRTKCGAVDQNQDFGQGGQQQGFGTSDQRENGFNQNRTNTNRTQYGWQGYNANAAQTSNQNRQYLGLESQNVQIVANPGFHGNGNVNNRSQFGWVGFNDNPNQPNQNIHHNHGLQTQHNQNVATDTNTFGVNAYGWHGFNVTHNASQWSNQNRHHGRQDVTNTNPVGNFHQQTHGYNHGFQTIHKSNVSTDHHGNPIIRDQVPYGWHGFNVTHNANRTQSSNQTRHHGTQGGHYVVNINQFGIPNVQYGTRTSNQQFPHQIHNHRTQNATTVNRNKFPQSHNVNENLHWQGGQGQYVRPIYVQIQPADQTTQVPKHSPAPFPRTDPNADYVFEDKDFVEVDDLGTGRKDVCSAKDFRCSKDVCVDQMKVCDGYADCDGAEDEINCERYVEQFAMIPKAKLAVKEKAKYFNMTLSLCAKSCTESKGYRCMAFNYRKNDATCFVLDTNVGLSGGLFMLANYDYYEYRKFTVDCTNMYVCRNNKCLSNDRVCDGVKDCVDGIDEKGCKAEKLGYGVKLVGSPNPHEGIALVSAFGKSGFICDDMFGLRNGNVLCKELGFEMGALQVRGNSHSNSDSANETFYMMDDVTCLGNETSLRDCDFNGWGVHNCVDREIVSVVCKTPQKTCPEDTWKCETGNDCVPFSFVCDGVDDCDDRSDEGSQYCEAAVELRLAGGKSKKDGRVEIKYHGSWGTVCDDDFNDEAAKVVCKYLGYAGFSKVKKDGYYGPGKGQIWLDQVFCQGNETTLENCYHWDWGVHNCDHSEDVGVECGDRIEESPRNAKPDITQAIPTSAFSNRCGYRNDDIFLENDDVHFRVVKGLVARKGHYPWQASLRLNIKNKASHWCGAVVLSHRFVLTAAHCLSGYSKGGFGVVVGDYEVNVDEGTEQQAYIEEFYIHPEFRNGTRMNNDVALVKLKGNGLNLTQDVQPICLPDADFKTEQGMNCTISGFGSVQSGKAVASKELRAGWIPIQPIEVCKMPHIYGQSITEGMLCAGSLDEGVDACDGDSGGPLACLIDGLFTLVGVTSWGQHCGYANKPGVYVNVAHYRNWIDETIRKHN